MREKKKNVFHFKFINARGKRKSLARIDEIQPRGVFFTADSEKFRVRAGDEKIYLHAYGAAGSKAHLKIKIDGKRSVKER